MIREIHRRRGLSSIRVPERESTMAGRHDSRPASQGVERSHLQPEAQNRQKQSQTMNSQSLPQVITSSSKAPLPKTPQPPPLNYTTSWGLSIQIPELMGCFSFKPPQESHSTSIPLLGAREPLCPTLVVITTLGCLASKPERPELGMGVVRDTQEGTREEK